MSTQLGNFAVLALTCVVGTIALLLGTLTLAYASRRKHDTLGMSRGEAFAMAVVFLICGLGITYISLVAIGHAPLASTLPHWTPANFHPIRGVTTVDVWSWARYSVASALVAVTYPAETDDEYNERVARDFESGPAEGYDGEFIRYNLSKLSDVAYTALGEAYIMRGTLQHGEALHALEMEGMAEHNGELTFFGRAVAAYVIMHGRAMVLSTAMRAMIGREVNPYIS